MLILADEEKKDLQNKIAALEMDLDDTKQKLWKVSAHKEQLLSEQEQARGIKQGLINIRNFNKLPTSAYDVAQFFRKCFVIQLILQIGGCVRSRTAQQDPKSYGNVFLLWQLN